MKKVGIMPGNLGVIPTFSSYDILYGRAQFYTNVGAEMELLVRILLDGLLFLNYGSIMQL